MAPFRRRDIGSLVMTVKVGSRVIRGVDWIYKNQDGGPGHVGTVTVIEGPLLCGPCFPPFTALVQWDVGNKGLYRIGHNHAFDLRQLEMAATGMVHRKVWCDGCSKSEIKGFRWRCTECYGIDLCTDCYMGDKHDIRHVFMRVRCSDYSSMGEKVPPRCTSSFSPIYGFFPGAKVVKFPPCIQRVASDSWLGKIVARSCAPEMGQKCGKATVEIRGVTSEVHCGWNGKVDIMCTFPGQGGEIYETHLPDMGDAGRPAIGDKVVLIVNLDESRILQQRRALPELSAEILGKEGVVTQRSEQGNLAVNFTGSSQQTVWINPFALMQIDTFCPCQTVMINFDEGLATRFPSRRSNKNDIKEFLGKEGRVMKIMTDGDVQVRFDDKRRCFFKAVCLIPFSPEPVPEYDSSHLSAAAVERLAYSKGYSPLIHILMASKEGLTDTVRIFVDNEPEVVEYEIVPGMTLVSCLTPYDHAMDVMKLLVDRGAFIEGLGGSFPTPLMRAVHLNKPAVVNLLVSHGADIDITDGEGKTSLYMAVERGHFQCVHYLLQHDADVNCRVSSMRFGLPSAEENWTALHFATRNESRTVVDLLTARKDTDFKAVSSERQGAETAVHLAAKSNNLYLMRKVLERVPCLSKTRTTHEETALHIAARYNSVSVAKYLVEQDGCEINLCNKLAGNTPLMMALLSLHLDMVDVLLKNGASCNIRNHDTLTGLQLAIALAKNAEFTTDHERTPFIREMKEKWGKKGVKSTGDALIAYLVSHGGDLDYISCVTRVGKGRTIRNFLRNLRDPILPALEAIERQRRSNNHGPRTKAKQSKSKQKSKGNKKKASNPQPESETSATPGFQRLRKVSEPVEQDGAKLDLADLVSSRQVSKGKTRNVRAEDESTSETAHKSLGSSVSDKTAAASADTAQPGRSDASRSSPTESEVITKLKTKLRDLEKEADSLHRDLRRFDHLTAMRISFACGHDVIKSVADLVPDCPSCRGMLTGVVLHTSDGCGDVHDS